MPENEAQARQSGTERRRVVLEVTTTYEFEIDEPKAADLFGDRPTDEQLANRASQWIYDGESAEGLAEDFCAEDFDYFPSGHIDAAVESQCEKHETWRLAPGKFSSGCYRCDQEEREALADKVPLVGGER